MITMDKLTTGVAYGSAIGNVSFWGLRLLDAATPAQWTAIGVLGGLIFGALTFFINLIFKIREDRRRERAYKHGKG